ncbi:MAG: glycosyltransferase [Nitrolancea sp.]
MLQLVDVATASIEDYAPIVGIEVIDRLRTLAKDLKGARILHVNATAYGGGVSELLRSSVSIQRGLGLDVEWRVISGSQSFFEVTKSIHNALQGADYAFTPEARETYLLQNSYNAQQFEGDYDFVVVHDPQPAALLHFRGHDSHKWVWRCHIDTSSPNRDVLQALLPYIDEYDALVFTLGKFVPEMLKDRNVRLIPPGIDPLSPKNFDIPDDQCRRILSWVGVHPDEPIMTQVSRFDPWKDPMGVIRVYRRVRESVPNLQLALIGSLALDDPEAWELLRDVQHEAAGDSRILVATNLTGIGNTEVNVFQRQSDVVLQKSIREGFGLIVSETLWKGTPMVAGNTGGIPMQMPAGAGGYLVDPLDEEEMARKALCLLKDGEGAAELGRRGKEHIRQHFLITRMIEQELELLSSLND